MTKKIEVPIQEWMILITNHDITTYIMLDLQHFNLYHVRLTNQYRMVYEYLINLTVIKMTNYILDYAPKFR
jgi:hypothetical protein